MHLRFLFLVLALCLVTGCGQSLNCANATIILKG